jgi:tyrosinase
MGYVQALVQTYDISIRPKYQAAADVLRLAYWDWASIPTMPGVVEQPTLNITTGSGNQMVTNPFYQYRFQNFPLDPKLFPADPHKAGDWWLARYNVTVRGAAQRGGPSNPGLANSYLLGSELMKNTVSHH